MRFKLAFLATIVLMASLAHAISIDAESFGQYKDKVNAMERGQNKALDTLMDQFANDVVELELEDTGEIITIEMQDGKVQQITEGSTGEATIKLTTTEEAITQIVEGGDPAKLALDAVSQEKIKVEVIEGGFFKRLMFWLTKMVSKFLSLFA